jgi:signal transduction histidine kinase
MTIDLQQGGSTPVEAGDVIGNVALLCRQLAEIQDLETFWDTVVARVCEALPMRRCCVLMDDATGQNCVLMASHEQTLEGGLNIDVLAVGHDFIGKAFSATRPGWVDAPPHGGPLADPLRAWLCGDSPESLLAIPFARTTEHRVVMFCDLDADDSIQAGIGSVAEIIGLQIDAVYESLSSRVRLAGTQAAFQAELNQHRREELDIDVLERFSAENPSPVMRIEDDGNVLYANSASTPLLRQWGCRVNERLPETWRSLVQRTLQDDAALYTEIVCGRQVFALSLLPIFKDQCVNIYGQDITGRKQVDEKMRLLVRGTSQFTGTDFFRSLVRYLADALNVRYAFISEVTRASDDRALLVAAWSDGEWIDPCEYDTRGTPCWHAIKSRVFCPAGVQDMFPDDVRLQELGAASYLAMPMSDSGGNVIGHLGVIDSNPMSDSSQAQSILTIFASRAAAEFERIRAERQIRDQLKFLEAVNYELDQFAHIVSHDLKAPLRAIKNLSGWLEEDGAEQLNDDCLDYLHQLQDRVNKMDCLIDGILQYSRATRDVPDPQFESINIADSVAGAIDLVNPPSGFSIEVGDDMPTVTCQRAYLLQIFSNLIGNAVKHHDKETGVVRVSAVDLGQYIEVSVADDGPGIDPGDHERVFVIFQTAGSREAPDSTGVGLSIVKKIVENHLGTLEVISEPGSGAEFRFTWPKDASVEKDERLPAPGESTCKLPPA